MMLNSSEKHKQKICIIIQITNFLSWFCFQCEWHHILHFQYNAHHKRPVISLKSKFQVHSHSCKSLSTNNNKKKSQFKANRDVQTLSFECHIFTYIKMKINLFRIVVNSQSQAKLQVHHKQHCDSMQETPSTRGPELLGLQSAGADYNANCYLTLQSVTTLLSPCNHNQSAPYCHHVITVSQHPTVTM